MNIKEHEAIIDLYKANTNPKFICKAFKITKAELYKVLRSNNVFIKKICYWDDNSFNIRTDYLSEIPIDNEYSIFELKRYR